MGADTNADDGVLSDPQRWTTLALILTSVIHGQALPGMTGQRYVR